MERTLPNNPDFDTVKTAVLHAKVLREGHFVFANGGHGNIKLEMDKLWESSQDLDLVLHALAQACLILNSDIVLGVPTGGQRLANALGERKLIEVPVLQLERIPGTKQDFRFKQDSDQEVAQQARRPCVVEDVVTTLSSVARVVRLLKPNLQDIHSLAIWRRGVVSEEYRKGVTDHYLVEQELPVFSREGCVYCMFS